ncbi:sensor domain-containing diguanylate cyclase [Caenispirillum bisanense]|uniref:GGDEF domain-containing protein n=1 Tax=Caenispirillum bisanense TaxID=414052 RepID=UPI0031D93584
MMEAPIPVDDGARVASLRSMNLIATPAEPALDGITRLARRLAKAPMALVSVVDAERQWFLSRVGMEASEAPRRTSFCGHAIVQEEPFVIPDARLDVRFADNPVVTGPPFVRSYAGIPLRNGDGHAIGTLCVIDTRPRQFMDSVLDALTDLARLAEIGLENRRLGETQRQLVAELDEARREALLCPLTQAWNRRGFDLLYQREAAKAAREGVPLGLAVLDIDHFKRINDTHGHETGDRAIRLFAEILRGSLRPYDTLCRIGGEEFVALLPGVTETGLEAIGHKLLTAVRSQGLLPVDEHAPPPHRFTTSIGMVTVALAAAAGAAAQALALRRADEALYRAKSDGRDRLDLAPPVEG